MERFFNMQDITLINDDCFKAMQSMPDKSVDLILCDLPYAVLNKGNKDAQWDKMLPLDDLWAQYERLIKDNGAIVLFAQGMFTAKLMMSNPKIWRYNLVWDKINRPTGFLNANRCPLRIHEDICVFYKKQPTYNPQFTKGAKLHSIGKCGNGEGTAGKNRCYGKFKQTEVVMTDDKYPNSIIRIPKEHKNWYHPTQKPVALLEWLIKTYSNEGEMVLDNCAGSFSTAVACVNTNRKFIGMELNEEYYNIGVARVADAQRAMSKLLF